MKRESIRFCTTPLRRGEHGHFWDKGTGQNVRCRDLAKTPVGSVLACEREDGFWGTQETPKEQCPLHHR